MKKILCNFKMNLKENEIEEYINNIKDYKEIIFAPSYIYLKSFKEAGLKVSSQDVSEYINGAHTGDISAEQLKSINVEYCIVGHSERRMLHNDDSRINEKIKRLLENNIIPILCIGDTLEDKNTNNTLNKLYNQIDNALSNTNIKNIIIAYEPVYSIGTNIIPTNENLKEIIIKIKEKIENTYQIQPLVLYGGSVNENNISILNSINEVDGYLIGGCSLDYKKIIEIYKKSNIRHN